MIKKLVDNNHVTKFTIKLEIGYVIMTNWKQQFASVKHRDTPANFEESSFDVTDIFNRALLFHRWSCFNLVLPLCFVRRFHNRRPLIMSARVFDLSTRFPRNSKVRLVEAAFKFHVWPKRRPEKGICRLQGDSLDTTIMRPARQPLQSEYKQASDEGPEDSSFRNEVVFS